MSSNANNACSTAFSEGDLLGALQTHGGEQARHVMRNPKLLKATFDLLSAIKSSRSMGGASAIASGISAGAKALDADPGVQQAARLASFSLGTFKTTMGMSRLFSMDQASLMMRVSNITKIGSPGAVIAYLSATAIQKTGVAVSLTGNDNERAKCVGAVMELAGSAVIASATAWTGVLAVLQAASLTASAMNALYACQLIDTP